MDARETIADVLVKHFFPAAWQESRNVNRSGFLELAEEILAAIGADETRHEVKIEDGGYVIQHPLRERLEGSLFDCDVIHILESPAGADIELKDGVYWLSRLGSSRIILEEKS